MTLAQNDVAVTVVSENSKHPEVELSVVVPVFKSAETITELVRRIAAALEVRFPGRYEIILVDDASPDQTWDRIVLAANHCPTLRGLRLAKNAGQHNATLCGMRASRGKTVVTMDDDLQHDPADIPKLVDAVHGGADLAVAAFRKKEHASARNFFGRCVDSLLKRIFALPSEFQLTTFRAARRSIVDRVIAIENPYPYVTALLLAQTSRCRNVEVEHGKRQVGRSNYTWLKSLRLAANILAFYSSVPVYLALFMCLFAILFSVGLTVWIVFKAIFEGISVPGWASLMVFGATFNAMILFALTIQGVYVARLAKASLGTRVPYVVSEEHGS